MRRRGTDPETPSSRGAIFATERQRDGNCVDVARRVAGKHSRRLHVKDCGANRLHPKRRRFFFAALFVAAHPSRRLSSCASNASRGSTWAKLSHARFDTAVTTSFLRTSVFPRASRSTVVSWPCRTTPEALPRASSAMGRGPLLAGAILLGVVTSARGYSRSMNEISSRSGESGCGFSEKMRVFTVGCPWRGGRGDTRFPPPC